MIGLRLFLALTLLSLFSPHAFSATLVHSNDILGEFEPCGCRRNPTGGLSRRENWIARLGDPELLQIDAGDLLFDSAKIADLLKDQAKLQARFVLKALDQRASTLLLVPGEKDFALGLRAYAELIGRSRAKTIVSNAKLFGVKGPPLPWAESYVWKFKDPKTGKPLRVTFLGVLGSRAEGLEWPSELRIVPPAQALKPLITKYRAASDLLVVISHEGLAADHLLAKAVSGIDLIVGSHTQSFLQKPEREGKTWIVQASFRDQQVGAWKLAVPLDESAYQMTELGEEYVSPPEHPNLVDPVIAEAKTAIATLNSAKDAKLALSGPRGEHSTLGPQTFVRCAECHLKQFDFWRQTPHARAMEPLIAAHQNKNMECLRCHSVGQGELHGWSRLEELGSLRTPADAAANAMPRTESFAQNAIEEYLHELHRAPNLKAKIKVLRSDSEAVSIRSGLARIDKLHVPVQCENCHTGGSEHPFAGQITRKPAVATCLQCHSRERAPEWYSDPAVIEFKLKAMSCPAGELADEDSGN